MTKRRVIVGLSGGVDSSVSAKLLLDQGYETIGVFLKNWDEKDKNCMAAEDVADARNVAAKLNIPFYVFDFSQEYRKHVFQYFLEENKAGRTPNPDILCNKFIKFGVFLEQTKKLGADFIATGHYARKVFNENTEQFELHIPVDKNKDQTYFLHALTQQQLEKSLFPLAKFTKPEVRKLAKEYGFKNAEKKDSTGICFIGKRPYSEFLQQYLAKKPGEIITQKRQIIGKHIGLSFYTIGQRKELGVGGVKDYRDAPWFVVEKRFKTNELMVSQDENLLLSTFLLATNLTWTCGRIPKEKFFCEARIRYRQGSQSCAVKQISSDEVEVKFKTPQRAVTPGQSVVFYQGAVCLGGGVIK